MNQRAIENHAGIDDAVAKFMMTSDTPQAKTAIDLLRLAVALPEVGALSLLCAAVKDCKATMAEKAET